MPSLILHSANLDLVVSPLFNPAIQRWEGLCANILAPDGTYVPVSTPSAPRNIGAGRFQGVQYDNQLEIASLGYSASSDSNDITPRIVAIFRMNTKGEIYRDPNSSFDYERHGFKRIGNILVNPQNQNDVTIATQREQKDRRDKYISTAITLAFFALVLFSLLSSPSKEESPRPFL